MRRKWIKRIAAVITIFSILSVCLFSLVYASEINLASAPTAGLVAYYPLDENANDQSGYNTNGTEYGGVQYVDGVIGNAAKFDGIDDYIQVNDSDNLNPGTDMTVSAWINIDTIQGSEAYSHIISKWGPDGNASYELGLDINSNQVFLGLHNGQSNYFVTSNSLERGKWYYITATCTINSIKLYVNGQIQDYKEMNNNPMNDTNPLTIGRENTVYRWFFKGLLDDIRIYNRAISESEIQDLYRCGLDITSIAVTTPPIKAQYLVGKPIDLTGLVVTATYSDGSTDIIPVTESMINGFDSSAPALGQTVTVTVDGISAVFNVDIIQLVTSITVTGAGSAGSVTNGSTLQMIANIMPSNATNKSVTWSVKNGTGRATINSSGVLAGTKVGTVTVIATANDGSSVKGSVTIKVVGNKRK